MATMTVRPWGFLGQNQRDGPRLFREKPINRSLKLPSTHLFKMLPSGALLGAWYEFMAGKNNHNESPMIALRGDMT